MIDGINMLDTDSSSSATKAPPIKIKESKIYKVVPLYILIAIFLINIGTIYATIGKNKNKTTTLSENQIKNNSTTISLAEEAVLNNETEEDANISINEGDSQKTISAYTVEKGDTLSNIAEKFNISVNTIRWANDLSPKSNIKEGDELVILPVSGIEYTIKKGDTISAIANKYKSNQADILKYNDIDPKTIKPGIRIVIPEAEPLTSISASTAKNKESVVKKIEKKVVKEPTKKVVEVAEKTVSKIVPTVLAANISEVSNTVTQEKDKDAVLEKSTENTEGKKEVEENKKFVNPISNAILTQGVHDGNAVDFGVAVGTPVHATGDGKVIIAKSSGYNGGYGSYIVINHDKGGQTLYGHLSKVTVSVGDTVSAGDNIGLSGNSGKSTGPHLHYKEIGTGTKNTFAKFKIGTHF